MYFKIAVGLFELVKTSAQNIHSRDDWALVFTLLETTGAGAMHLKQDECLTGIIGLLYNIMDITLQRHYLFILI